jgi:hypothetical protein
LLTHQHRRLQLAGGGPYDKYTFPPTRNSEFGWWTSHAQRQLKQELGKHPKSTIDMTKLNVLLDAQLGRYHNKRPFDPEHTSQEQN